MRICVFLGSKPGKRPQYLEQAKRLAKYLADSNIGLVYGGASIGLMGEVAKTAMDAGGEVIGVIPHRLAEFEIAADFITELTLVDTLEEREKLMFELSDGFIALPGGVGTLEEFFTALTWNVLKYHSKPIGLLNTCGYYNKLLELLDFQCKEGFIPRNWLEPLIVDESVEMLVDSIRLSGENTQT